MKLMDLFSLENQVAIVTGSLGGLGQELVKILLLAGAQVILVDINEEKLKQFATTIDPQHKKTFIQVCNVTNQKDIQTLIENAHHKYHRIDILVNCAGILGNDAAMFDVTEADWDAVMAVNLKGSWMMATAVAQYMVQHKISGNIVNISSALGFRAQLKRVAYATSKAGVEHLTRNLAMELVKYDIRVNCLAPGWIATEMVRPILEGPEGKKWRAAIPMRRAAEPQELMGALLLLASRASSYMTGNVLRVDGGYSYCGLELPE